MNGSRHDTKPASLVGQDFKEREVTLTDTDIYT